jgi:hypothetical protein
MLKSSTDLTGFYMRSKRRGGIRCEKEGVKQLLTDTFKTLRLLQTEKYAPNVQKSNAGT